MATKNKQDGINIDNVTIFDDNWYISKFPDVEMTGMKPIEHYLWIGRRLGRDGHPDVLNMYNSRREGEEDFEDINESSYLKKLIQLEDAKKEEIIKTSILMNEDWYKSQQIESDRNNISCYSHYLKSGYKKGLNPHPLFDTNFYLVNNPDLERYKINPLLHFILVGHKKRKNPHPLFDIDYYIDQVGEEIISGHNPLEHYLLYGEKNLINPHPIFNANYYTNEYRDVADSGMNPLIHFLLYGAKELRNPHPLFKTSFYVLSNPELTEGINPLIHYLKVAVTTKKNPHPFFDTEFFLSQFTENNNINFNPLLQYIKNWDKDLKNPHPLFDTKWYMENNTDLKTMRVSPLEHYITVGEARRSSPSSYFNVDWYLRCNLDVASAGVSPIEHYLSNGIHEGREPNREVGIIGTPIIANLDCIKSPLFNREVALFVTHSIGGILKPHINHYIDALKRCGISVILIVASDEKLKTIDRELMENVSGLFLRENKGYDFAAWAHILSLFSEIMDSEILYMINDSVFGPTNFKLFEDILNKIRTSEADFIGLTDSYEGCWHIQSYFMAFKEKCLRSKFFKNFFRDIVVFKNKTSVIAEYEMQIASYMKLNGIKVESIFPFGKSESINRTTYLWKNLLQSGFPFLKVSNFKEQIEEMNNNDWRSILLDHGYDVSIIEKTISYFQKLGKKTRESKISIDNIDFDYLEEGFDEDFYLKIYPDVRAAGVDPRDHYLRYGRQEGRISRMPREIEALDRLHERFGSRDCVLVVSHEGVRGGAPIIAYTLIKDLLKKYNVIAMFLADGPLLKNCIDDGAFVIGPAGLTSSVQFREMVIDRILRITQLKFAILNTIVSRILLPDLHRHFIPSVTLIHEFASYIRPDSAFIDVAIWSSEIVFSAEITRDSFFSKHHELSMKKYPIIPQGICEVPKKISDNCVSKKEKDIIQSVIRPGGFNSNELIVIGVGFCEYRKGVDLMIDCAARVFAELPDISCKFVWIGRGYDPDKDTGYSSYLLDQIQRSGLDGRFIFFGEAYDMEAVYQVSDILILSSRLDPLPNVAIEAMAYGLPVICFANSTGIAKILEESGQSENTVAKYLDTVDMSNKLTLMLKSKDIRRKLSEKNKEIARLIFDRNKYIDRIEDISIKSKIKMTQEKKDVETILESEIERLDFYLFPGQDEISREEVVRGYVRKWSSGIMRRKLFPGFHPGIYTEERGLKNKNSDPLAEYIREGQPSGIWKFEVIDPSDNYKIEHSRARIGLHVHAYHLHVFPEIIEKIKKNRVRPDLLISVKSQDARKKIEKLVEDYQGGKVDIRIVPDPGRDVGPFLTEFREELLHEYDVIGHLHTKTSEYINNRSAAKTWVKFLLENVIGNEKFCMADIIISKIIEDEKVGIVFPDDPHVIGWDKNKKYVENYCSNFSMEHFPDNIHFPVGAMFWARPKALKPMFDLKLDWADYPVEPLPYDGSLLHGLERLYGISAMQSGFNIVNTNIRGLTR